MNINETLAERERSYGDFENFSMVAKMLKQIIRNEIEDCEDLPGQWEDYFTESLEMIIHKIVRIINGDPYHMDSWRDIAGYATLVVNILEKNEP